MSQPANDEFSQHLSDDEASNHEDASDTGAAPKQQQQAIPQTTAISNIKLPQFEEGGKAVFKQQFKAFTISSSEGLEKGYDIFQQLLSQLKAHDAEVSTKDANHKFLRSLPPAWSNLAMTMRTKPNVDTLSIDDLYNNLRVFEQEIQGASKKPSSSDKITCTLLTSSTKFPEMKLVLVLVMKLFIPILANNQSEGLGLLQKTWNKIDDLGH
ncbi:hypothetical protein Tco_1002188 [Tanacetum coccineum]|uniref:Uncharacterized protein n=1 Tax=Tanacetum coccineum TaxID=301880 RepID=A0ABQ5F5Y1_9ASTR